MRSARTGRPRAHACSASQKPWNPAGALVTARSVIVVSVGLTLPSRLHPGHRKIPRRSSFGDCWREAVEKAGLPKGTRFHDLRHYYASTLIAANLNPKSIQRRLGHATISETFDAYGHLFPDDEALGRGAIDAEIEKDLAEQSRDKKQEGSMYPHPCSEGWK
ncbi:tyrosine-type recombinase/integrase [Nonomuraea sp. NPDC050383]|uniref:tyrosine-type recombinase/integrase n=1 Tax=Nonomuraea sp. NPDC050383 TaxID=3364362 RepID=UPI0037B3B15E